MRAGGPEVLEAVELDVPQPGDGELLVEVAATGVNFVDVYRRTGTYDVPFPHVPGTEFAGRVAAVGAGVEGFAVGDRVVTAEGREAYARFAVVPADAAAAVPDGVRDETAAALALQGLTAHYLVTSVYPVEAGTSLLVHAGAGGVGLLLIQLAKARGATVFTTVGSPEKGELATAAGADASSSTTASATGPCAERTALGLDVVSTGSGRRPGRARWVAASGAACSRCSARRLRPRAADRSAASDVRRIPGAHPAVDGRLPADPRGARRGATRELLEAVAAGTLDVQIGATFAARRRRGRASGPRGSRHDGQGAARRADRSAGQTGPGLDDGLQAARAPASIRRPTRCSPSEASRPGRRG